MNEQNSGTKKYRVTFREVYLSVYEVEATSEKEAYDIANRDCVNGVSADLHEYNHTLEFDWGHDIECLTLDDDTTTEEES